MAMATQEDLISQVLKLPQKDLDQLFQQILLRMEEEEEASDVHEAWTKEIERRAEDVLSGKAKSVPWTKVRKQLEAKLRAPRR